jgi:ABC-type dipeptide/oligopeptide/nickel transport system permease subunit
MVALILLTASFLVLGETVRDVMDPRHRVPIRGRRRREPNG